MNAQRFQSSWARLCVIVFARAADVYVCTKFVLRSFGVGSWCEWWGGWWHPALNDDASVPNDGDDDDNGNGGEDVNQNALYRDWAACVRALSFSISLIALLLVILLPTLYLPLVLSVSSVCTPQNTQICQHNQTQTHGRSPVEHIYLR